MLLYQQDLAKVEKSVLDQFKRFGVPLPKELTSEKPRLFEGLQYVLESFFELDSERHHGQGLMRIPWSSIVSYAKHHELSYDETEDFIYLIRRLDSAVLDRLHKEQDAKMKKK